VRVRCRSGAGQMPSCNENPAGFLQVVLLVLRTATHCMLPAAELCKVEWQVVLGCSRQASGCHRAPPCWKAGLRVPQGPPVLEGRPPGATGPPRAGRQASGCHRPCAGRQASGCHRGPLCWKAGLRVPQGPPVLGGGLCSRHTSPVPLTCTVDDLLSVWLVTVEQIGQFAQHSRRHAGRRTSGSPFRTCGTKHMQSP
jgi:hypothetical protein